MKRSTISAYQVAATYIGTIIGAGFASGQEVLQFFVRFGQKGLYGIIITSIMFIFFGYIIMELGNRIRAFSYLDILKYSNSKYLKAVVDFLISLFLFGSLTVMIAGTGALFEQQFGYSELVGSLIMAGLSIITVLAGIDGVVKSISFLIPFLLTFVIGICILSIIKAPPVLSAMDIIISENFLIRNWILSAFLYTSYNIIVSIAVLGPLGAKIKSNRVIKKGALYGGLGIGLCSLFIYLAINGHIAQIESIEVPMVYIAGSISLPIQLIYAGVLIAAVYTTAISSLYGFVVRLTNRGRSYFSMRILVILTTVVALLLSQFGFSNLVKLLYPLVGYGGVLLLIMLLHSKLKMTFKYKKKIERK